MRARVLLAAGALVLGGLPLLSATPAAGATGRSIVVAGTDVGPDRVYPAFDPTITRYGIRPTAATAGSLTVTATTDDPDGAIAVNGRPVASGDPVPVTGLEPGDEIAVQISDADGTTSYAFAYLHEGFPEIETTSTGAGPAPGGVFLGLVRPFPGFNANVVVDEHGVPTFQGPIGAGSDFRVQPDGRYSWALPTTTPGRSGQRIVALDPRFEEEDSYETVGLVNTDFHDSILRPDGSRILIAYEVDHRPDEPSESYVDAVVQEIDADGQVAFEWNSKDHIDDPEVEGLAGQTPFGFDYAHINSVDVAADGNLLVSLRNTSQVLKIARTDHDGHLEGDVIWRLGGIENDFVFVDDPYGGPCAQHTAYETGPDTILLFDNGSEFDAGSGQRESMCPDPDDPDGGRIDRPQSRAVEYAIDTTVDPPTATVVWDYEVEDRFSWFAGSTQRLPNGNTLISWSNEPPVTSEVDAAGEEVWHLTAAGGFRTYRAFRGDAPDAFDPEVEVVTPADGAVFTLNQALTADYECTDRGGSNLATCEGTVAPGEALDTSSLGEHEFEVTASDGAGNTTTVTNTYEITPCASHPYPDVDPWVTDAVTWAHCHELLTGYADDTFRPDLPMTRAQVARFLHRTAGTPDTSALPPHGFSDVPLWVEDAVTWLAANDYATGYADDTFRPNRPITRAQVTRMLFRIAGSPTGAPPHPWSDVPPWVTDAVDWISDPANQPPWATGYADGTYRPDDDITRAQTTRMNCRVNNPPGSC